MSKRDLMTVMMSDPNYVVSMAKVSNIPRRHTKVHGYMTLAEADLAEFPPFKNYSKALVLIDVFSRRIWAKALQTKSAKEVKEKFEEIWRETQKTPEVLATDGGSEFTGNLKYFEEKGIFLKKKIWRSQSFLC